MHIYLLLMIVAGLSKSRGEVTTETFDICGGSRYNNMTITAASSPFIIRSQAVGIATYSNNMDCTLVLESGTEPLVLSFEFRAFSLEESPSCSSDWLCLNGDLLCASSVNGALYTYILPENSNFTIHFQTDYSVTMSGFQIEVSQELATNQTVQQSRKGFFSNNGNLTYTEETYRPGYPYSNRCARPIVRIPDYIREFNTEFITRPRFRIPEYISEFTTASTDHGVCYPAVDVRQVNEILNQAIARLHRAKTLLNQRK